MTRTRGISLLQLIMGMLFMCTFPAGLAGGAAEPADRIEVSFRLPQVQGNPFDFTTNDVWVTFTTPSGGEVSVPAFYDGQTTWKARHTPESAGSWRVKSISLNGDKVQPDSLSSNEFHCPAPAGHGFIRIDRRDKMRLAFDDGTPFYPVGYNLAWRAHEPVEMPPLVESLDRMGKAGVNWTRIWMNYWDGKNLDWPVDPGTHLEPGTLLLPVARDWDAIVDAAARNHIHFQMVLQHHGQYTLKADTNWSINPWNKANGGWLETPQQFFTDPRAIALTKAKFRYIIARWGYSPAIMAFELFNEVESTDGYKQDVASVAAWHRMMADFIRRQDRYKHLITTSSNTTEPALWPATDYYQAHAYPSDLISAIAGLEDQKLSRAYFFGEMGASSSSPAPPRDTIHRILWASLMSASAGTGEYWDWFEVEPRNLLGQFTSVQEFIRQSGMLSDRELHPVRVEVQTARLGPLTFGPGRDWSASASTQFVVDADGSVTNLGGMSAFLQGRGHNQAMFPHAEFAVNFSEVGTFSIECDQTTAAGARLEAGIDGKPAAAMIIGPSHPRTPQANRDQNNHFDATLEVPVPAGPHTIRIENTGDDWIHIRQFRLTPYAPELAVLAKANRNMALLWVYRREAGGGAGPVTGQIKVSSLATATYRVAWWDTDKGSIISQTDSQAGNDGILTLTTPPIQRDAACWIVKTTE